MKTTPATQRLARMFKKLYRTMTTWDLRRLAIQMTCVGVVLGIVGSYYGYTRIYLNDERRFWAAVEQSMAVPSVTRTIKSGGSGNAVTQDQQFIFSPQKATRSKVTFIQKNATVDTKVTTEGLSFTDKSFSRYTSFSTNQKKADGTTPNLDDILGKWEGITFTGDDVDQRRADYIGEMVTLSIFGNFDAAFRREVIAELKQNAYDVRFDSAAREVVDGRDVLSVPVGVRLKPYVTKLQQSFIRMGLGEFAALNPENYEASTVVNSMFHIDIKSGTISGIEFGDRKESYHGYGIVQHITTPEASFGSGELEQKVNSVLGELF